MDKDKSYTIAVKIHTGSSRRGIEIKNSVYHLFTPKNPISGEANEDAIKIIAGEYRIAKKNITIIKGSKSRNKVFRIYSSNKYRDEERKRRNE